MAEKTAVRGRPQSVPELLARNVAQFGSKPAYREKEFGIWQSWTWREAADEIEAIALGFLALGAAEGDHIAIIGRNRPALYWSMVAAMKIGAVPVPLAWGEIYSSLQQNLIDGQESALSSMVQERFFEVQDYVSLSRHIYWPELWIADLNWWNGLDDADRDMITKAAAETVTLQRNLAAEANGSTLDELAAKGLAINELPAEDRARMGETMNGAIEADIRAKVGNEFYDRFMAELQN